MKERKKENIAVLEKIKREKILARKSQHDEKQARKKGNEKEEKRFKLK